MHVNNVVLTEAEDTSQVLAKLESPGEPGLRSIGVDGLTGADPDHVRLGSRPRKIRCDDVDLVSVSPRLSRKEVDVLTDAAEVRIVVLGHERDAERARVLDASHRQRWRGDQLQTASDARPTL